MSNIAHKKPKQRRLFFLVGNQFFGSDYDVAATMVDGAYHHLSVSNVSDRLLLPLILCDRQVRFPCLVALLLNLRFVQGVDKFVSDVGGLQEKVKAKNGIRIPSATEAVKNSNMPTCAARGAGKARGGRDENLEKSVHVGLQLRVISKRPSANATGLGSGTRCLT